MENNLPEVRDDRELEKALQEADRVIMKKYMDSITACEVNPLPAELKNIDVNSIVRMNKVDKLVYDREENNQDKLMNVYNAVGLCGGSVINVVVSDGKKVEYYVGARASNVNEVAACQAALNGTLTGNFPGSAITQQKKSGLKACMERVFGEEDKRIVSFVSGIPGYKDDTNHENKKYIQGIERVVDAMQGQRYALVTISAPLSSEQISTIREGYEAIYSQLIPFAATQLNYSESDSNAVSETLTTGLTKTMSESISNTVSNSTSSTTGTSYSKSVNASVYAGIPYVGGAGISVGTSTGTSSSNSVQNGTSQGSISAESQASSNTEGKTESYTSTNGRSMQISLENKAVKVLLQKIDKLLERIGKSEDLGLWSTATYCIADDSQTSRVLGSAVEALCRGKEASIEAFTVDTWTDQRKNTQVQQYLKRFLHPEITLQNGDHTYMISPASLINGKELVIEAGLPQKSLPGVAVSEMVAFSRNVVKENDYDHEQIRLGNICHMGRRENSPVDLDVESLSAHTLITGSTGSGKSNTVYHILNELVQKGVHFLVVEPAKGEYKNVFGNRPGVRVFGTNENFAELLRINPFKFPPSVHVLEHIDRLVEIFNVCWPMYAAMPAVLKDAVLCAYESCGWKLEDSDNKYGDGIYPTFKDLQRELVAVLERSAYSEEVKGNYIGSLVTRVKSLTNGINGKIFTNTDLEYADLFDGNVIIDLSRVGSSETKSLIMGIVVMSLNEYRMDQSLKMMNQKLKHITILEEAHNLLRNSASVSGGSEDGGNLIGKSVEMITNSIAEMRTYGEGFIIVDQSPSAIDISAIRNTNTKIIMRLPEESDRRQAGKSAALNEKQIDELAKLYRGTAVVYQNNWLDPVLCAIDKAKIMEEPYEYVPQNRRGRVDYSELLNLLMKNRVDEKLDFNLDNIERGIRSANISTKSRLMLERILADLRRGDEPALLQEDSFRKLSEMVVEILDCGERLHQYTEFGGNCDLLQQELDREIEQSALHMSKEGLLAVSQCIIRQIVENDNRQVDLYEKWREYAVESRKAVL